MSESLWAGLWNQIRRLFGRGHQFISIVVLLKVPRKLDELELRGAVERAWNVTLGDDSEPNNFVVMNGPVRLVQVKGHFFNVLSAARPYIEKREAFASKLRDLRVKAAVLEHSAWMSVDYHGSGASRLSKDDKYAATAKLVAELLDDDCLGICLPDEDVVIGNNIELKQVLREFKTVKDLWICGSDPILEFGTGVAEAAAEEARRRWPEFLSAYDGRQKGDRFLVKKRFADEENVEFMWIEVQMLQEATMSGVLMSDPMSLRQPRQGDVVSLTLADVEDWAYIRGRKIHGMFLKET
jgi:uncharacterized protein YegJ (DUF2314 family)